MPRPQENDCHGKLIDASGKPSLPVKEETAVARAVSSPSVLLSGLHPAHNGISMECKYSAKIPLSHNVHNHDRTIHHVPSVIVYSSQDEQAAHPSRAIRLSTQTEMHEGESSAKFF